MSQSQSLDDEIDKSPYTHFKEHSRGCEGHKDNLLHIWEQELVISRCNKLHKSVQVRAALKIS